MKTIDMIGKKFGRLTCMKLVGRGDHGFRYRFRCEDGVEIEARGNNVRSGHTTSCGCLAVELVSKRMTTHGRTMTSEYKTWKGMTQRCSNPKDKRYSDYGGRGIKVCQRWKCFENFLEDMGLRPSAAHSIERENNDGNYEPGNCRWATAAEQSRNRRGNTRITYNGETRILADWADYFGIKRSTMRGRLGRMSFEAAVAMPTRKCT